MELKSIEDALNKARSIAEQTQKTTTVYIERRPHSRRDQGLVYIGPSEDRSMVLQRIRKPFFETSTECRAPIDPNTVMRRDKTQGYVSVELPLDEEMCDIGTRARMAWALDTPYYTGMATREITVQPKFPYARTHGPAKYLLTDEQANMFIHRRGGSKLTYDDEYQLQDELCGKTKATLYDVLEAGARPDVILASACLEMLERGCPQVYGATVIGTMRHKQIPLESIASKLQAIGLQESGFILGIDMDCCGYLQSDNEQDIRRFVQAMDRVREKLSAEIMIQPSIYLARHVNRGN